MRRLLAAARVLASALAGAGLAVVTAAGPALAHSDLTSASPAPGEQVAPGLSVVALTFDGLSGPGQVTVTGPDGAAVPAGAAVLVDGETLCAAVTPLGTGVHAIAYEATSRDGDPVSGRFEFEVTESGAAAGDPPVCRGVALPAPAQPGGDDPGVGWLDWLAIGTGVVGLLAALAGAVLVARARRRARNRSPAP